MAWHLVWLLFGMCLQHSAAIRRKSKANQEANVTASCTAGGFCRCGRLGSDNDRVRPQYIWSARDVQYAVQDYYKSPYVACKPHSSYAVAYAAMTGERDAARCSAGPMKPLTQLAAVMNDALADLMTRYFVNVAEGTAPGADVDEVWTELKADAIDGNFNSLHYAMASTAIYLTSHMGLALSALPHSEELWKGTPHSTIAQRVDVMYAEYKPTYDAFNGFLSENVNTIGTALYDAGLVSRRSINIAAALVPGGGIEFFFERIRTKTFKEGMKVAAEIPLGQHPLTQQNGGIQVMATSPRISGTLSGKRGSALYELANHARFWRRWMGDGLGPVWKGLGGLDYNDLRTGSSRLAACQVALR